MQVTDDMVSRFLTWELPSDVRADSCAVVQGYPNRSGTNLLTHAQARAMLEYVLKEQPAEPVAPEHPSRAELEVAAIKAERRAVMFGDIVHSQVIAMRAAVVAAKLEGLDVGMQWIANTLEGPGHLPDLDEAKELGGAQALWGKETAEHEAFRAAHPAPTVPAAAPTAAPSAQPVAPDCLSMDDDGDVSINFRAGDDMLTMSVSKTGRLAYAWRTPEATNEPSGSGTVRVHVAVHEVLRAALAAAPSAPADRDEGRRSVSYSLISERSHKAMKRHICIWCGEAIFPGQHYVREFSTYDGDTQRHAWHPECRDASAVYFGSAE